MRTWENFGTSWFGKLLTIFGVADVRERGNCIFINVFLSYWVVAVTAFEHSSPRLELLAAHSQMVRGCLTLFTLLGFAIRFGTIEPLFGVENCVLGLNRFSWFIFFRGIVRVTRSEVVLRAALDTFDNVEVVDFSHDFVLKNFKAITENGFGLVFGDPVGTLFMGTFGKTIWGYELVFHVYPQTLFAD